MVVFAHRRWLSVRVVIRRRRLTGSPNRLGLELGFLCWCRAWGVEHGRDRSLWKNRGRDCRTRWDII
ncbi:putative basic proline-rich protein-like [Iris pallida]|uniref:Basic proline-rich protein-like n=1 Tax=Iris pallida TaxID=29817 RepID=A0AAX6F7V2_IRIPA|nr:putative basic proline-rich protein-like [Iris pallida]